MADPNSIATPRYTGLVCRRCLQPVAILSVHGERVAGNCPACTYTWIAAPPVELITARRTDSGA